MPESSAQRAFAASAFALMLALVCLGQFLPPFAETTLGSTPRTVLTAGALGLAVLLHWVYLGIGARRAGQSVGFWVGGMGVMLFPLGGAAALVLLGWVRPAAVVPAGLPRAG